MNKSKEEIEADRKLSVSEWVGTEGDSRKKTQDLAAWIANDPSFKASVDGVIDETLNDYKNQLGAYMIAYARRKVLRIEKLTSSMEEVEDELMKGARLHNARTSDLVKLMNNYRQQINDALALIEKVIQGQKVTIHVSDNSVTNVLNTIREREGAEVDVSKPAFRDRLRDMFLQIQEKANEIETKFEELDNDTSLNNATSLDKDD